MDLKKFYTEVLESFGMEVDKDGYIKVGNDELIIDGKPAVIPTVKIVSMLKSAGKAEVYLFNPLKGNKNIVRDEYKKLLYVMNVNLYAAIKTFMIDITEKFMNDDSSGLATPTTFARLMKVKGQAKKLVDEGVMKTINDLTYEELIEVNIKRNDVVLGERVDAALHIYSPILSGDVDTKFSRRKEKDYVKELLSIITEPIMDEKVTSSAGDKAQFMVLLKANILFYKHLSEFAGMHEVELNYPVPQYDMDEFGEDYDVLVSSADTLPDVVGDEVVLNDGIVTCSSEKPAEPRKRTGRQDVGVTRTKKDAIVERITVLKHKDALTLSELNELRDLEDALEEYEMIGRNDRMGRRSYSRSRRDDYDEYERDTGYYGTRRARRAPSVSELYNLSRSGRLSVDDDLPW